ncbi:putative sodium-coupled neutral amino acid transporter 7, partial [Nephila pilipes]
MSNADLSTGVLWQTLSKDVYTQGRVGKGEPSDVISEIRESLTESHPLLQLNAKDNLTKKAKGAGWLTTSFLLVNTALGIGILNFPAAYNQAGGIYYAIMIQLIMVTLMMTTMFILAYCSDVNGDRTYHDVLLSMCGKSGQQLAAVSITLTLYCVCIASLIVIGDQLDSLFFTFFGNGFCDRWYLRRSFTISVVAICFILPCCFCKRVDFLAFIGSLGIFAMLYPVFLTVYGYYKLTPKDVIIKTHPSDLSQMFAVFPVLGLGFQ